MEPASPTTYLSSLLLKTLRITTSDTRMFVGQFKCTDSDRNIILSQTFEYRLPPPPSASASASASDLSKLPSNPNSNSAGGTITLDMTSRYLGLVVVPGEYVVRIEVEEFVSQMEAGRKGALLEGRRMKEKGGKGKEREGGMGE